MTFIRSIVAGTVALSLLSAPAVAAVASQSATGFSVSYEAEVAADPKAAYEAFVRIGEWWDSEHTYSGDAKNLSIEVKPGGCWCEALPDGGFVGHMTVAQAMPGKSLMMKGGLGPLAFMGVEGTMVLSVQPKGNGTAVKLTYVVGGYDPKEFKEISKLVDEVLGAGFQRYATYAATEKP
jgi:hypothetical protein